MAKSQLLEVQSATYDNDVRIFRQSLLLHSKTHHTRRVHKYPLDDQTKRKVRLLILLKQIRRLLVHAVPKGQYLLLVRLGHHATPSPFREPTPEAQGIVHDAHHSQVQSGGFRGKGLVRSVDVQVGQTRVDADVLDARFRSWLSPGPGPWLNAGSSQLTTRSCVAPARVGTRLRICWRH